MKIKHICVATIAVLTILVIARGLKTRYEYSDAYSSKSNLSNHALFVYRDTWHRAFPGDSSGASCFVKLIDTTTGKCMRMKRFGSLLEIRDVRWTTNNVSIGIGNKWDFHIKNAPPTSPTTIDTML
jgi:hypothetical protein